tara:strand:+ start:2257 stop:2724 length:468 start_codon:yes stop_codon:yes gene_type:complete
MSDSINFRSFKKGDYETCVEWWEWWWGQYDADPIRRGFLPKDERCFIIEKNNIPVAATFLILSYDIPAVAWTTYLVSNPEYREKDRRELIETLITNVEKEAEKYGVLQLFTVCGNKHISDIHKNLGWDMSPARYEAFKYLTNNLKKIDKNYGEKG